MLEGRQALDLALELARMPTLTEAMRTHPLPPDTLVVIRIAAGCAETHRDAVQVTGYNPVAIKEACAFYLTQILFAPGADSYRVLGVAPGASRREMRRHMRWLMKWLHPDTNREDWESVFAERVLGAWREVGLRAPGAGGRGRASADRSAAAGRSAVPTQRWVALPLQVPGTTSARRRLVLAAVAVAGFLGLAVVLVPVLIPF